MKALRIIKLFIRKFGGRILDLGTPGQQKLVQQFTKCWVKRWVMIDLQFNEKGGLKRANRNYILPSVYTLATYAMHGWNALSSARGTQDSPECPRFVHSQIWHTAV